jgi:hypothetical protein
MVSYLPHIPCTASSKGKEEDDYKKMTNINYTMHLLAIHEALYGL